MNNSKIWNVQSINYDSYCTRLGNNYYIYTYDRKFHLFLICRHTGQFLKNHYHIVRNDIYNFKSCLSKCLLILLLTFIFDDIFSGDKSKFDDNFNLSLKL